MHSHSLNTYSHFTRTRTHSYTLALALHSHGGKMHGTRHSHCSASESADSALHSILTKSASEHSSALALLTQKSHTLRVSVKSALALHSMLRKFGTLDTRTYSILAENFFTRTFENTRIECKKLTRPISVRDHDALHHDSSLKVRGGRQQRIPTAAAAG